MPHASAMFSPAQVLNFKVRGTIKIRKRAKYTDCEVVTISVKFKDYPKVIVLGSVYSELMK